MVLNKALFLGTWALTLAGGLIVLGGLGALTADSEASPLFGPYRLAWTAWSLEVFALLVGLYALLPHNAFHNWRPTVLFFYAVVSPVLITLTNDVLVNKGGLPGSNGADTRANITAAGIIIVLIGNGLQALLFTTHDVPAAATAFSEGTEKGGV